MAKENKVYRVLFSNQQKVVELYCRHVYSSDLLGFVQLEGFLFDEASELIIDPNLERLRNEFASVKSSFVPLNAIIRIDEVDRPGVTKIREGEQSDIVPFVLPSKR